MIDAITSDLSDSARFEEPELVSGLVAWDERGRYYRFQSQRAKEGAPWEYTLGSEDPEGLRMALVRFLRYILQRRRRRRRAESCGLSTDVPDNASLELLLAYVDRLDLIHQY